MKKKLQLKKKLMSIIMVFVLAIAVLQPSVAGNCSELDLSQNSNWYYLWSFKSWMLSGESIEIEWNLNSTENIDGIDIIVADRDGKEQLLDTLSSKETKYVIKGEKVSWYRYITVSYFKMNDKEKIYGNPFTVENNRFLDYLLKDGIVGVKSHTQNEIKNMWKKLSPKNASTKYAVKPKNKATYKKGTVANSTLKNGINTLNFIRYVAGVNADVSIKDSYQSLAQASALVNCVNGSISHFPQKPKKMNQSLYQSGYQGASSSNIAMGYHNLYSTIVDGWMSDSDNSNIDVVGHRRWCINPEMKYTGFGIDRTFYSMYAFDKSRKEDGVHGVCWPAKNTPLNMFHNDDAWSISMGIMVPKDGTKVVLTRKRDNKKWKFSIKNTNKNGNYMNINNQGYGQTGCIVFKPKNIKYKAKDSFKVDISGKGFDFSYQVNFFNV